MSSEFLSIFVWWILLFFIGMAFFPISYSLFHKFIDGGYVFSKIIGLIIISYTSLVLGASHLLSFSRTNLFLILGASLFIILILNINYEHQKLRIKNHVPDFIKKHYKLLILEETIFLLAFIFWIFIRSHNPDIHDLEKFMDFGFINSILRSEYFPPKDIWFTPLSINYYYFGHLMTAVLTKISGVPSNISYNLTLCSIFAFCFTMSFSIGINLAKNIWDEKKIKRIPLFLGGLLSGFLVSLAGNIQTIYSFFKPYSGEKSPPFLNLPFQFETFPNSYWYPNATRFIYRTIHEFPIYSFVVADLHGHVLSIPIVLTLIGLLLNIFLAKEVKIRNVLFLGFITAIAYMTNAWDGAIYLGTSSLIISSVIFIKINSENKKINFSEKIVQTIKKLFPLILVITASFLIFSFPFNKFFSPFASGIGVICSPKFLIDLGSIGPFLFENGQCERSPVWQIFILYGFFFFLIFSFAIFILKRKKLITSDIFIILITFVSFGLIIAPEIIYLRDIYTTFFRANTMFKLGYQAFIMFSLISSYLIIRIFPQTFSMKFSFPKKIMSFVFIIFSSFLFFLVSIYPYFAVTSAYNLNGKMSLDGTFYLKEMRPEDHRAIEYLNKNVKGQPIILEAQGDSYTDYGRISVNTGLPTVLGWTVHEWLWRGSYDIPAGRFDDIKNLYESNNLSLTQKIINKYNISFVYIGGLEKEKYKVYENKFKILGEPIYTDKNTKIYKIN